MPSKIYIYHDTTKIIFQLQDFCNCLEKEGIFNATPSWFLSAEGAAPTHFQQAVSSPAFKNVTQSVDIQNEIDLFRSNQQCLNKEPIVIVVSDNILKPLFSMDDIVGAVKMDVPPTIDEIQARPFLIEYKDQYLVRWCVSDGKNLFFKPKNDSLICCIDWSKLGQILWHRRVI